MISLPESLIFVFLMPGIRPSALQA